MRYAAFLRGINVGGNKKVPMGELKLLFESIGFRNVKTLLNSGNVLFDADAENDAALTQKIEEHIQKKFGFSVGTIVRSVAELQKLFETEPFKKITVTPQTRLYVTFLSEKPTSKLKIPYESPQKNFKILAVTSTAVISVLTLLPEFKTTEAMNILEKEFGKKVTTRNWNTIERLLQLPV